MRRVHHITSKAQWRYLSVEAAKDPAKFGFVSRWRNNTIHTSRHGTPRGRAIYHALPPRKGVRRRA
jgi:hypothetical protein